MALSQLLQGLITTKHIRIIDQLAQSYLTGNDYVIAYRTQLGNMVEQHTQIYLAYDDDITTSRSHDKYVWLNFSL